MAKVKDLVVSTGEYQNAQGETKKRYQNVGSLMSGNDGGHYIILDRTFNPAGLPNPDNRSSCIVSLFDPKPRDEQQAAPVAPAMAGGAIDPDADLPF